MTREEELAALAAAATHYANLELMPYREMGGPAKDLCMLLNAVDLTEVEVSLGVAAVRDVPRETDARRALYVRTTLMRHASAMTPACRALAEELLARLSL